MHKLYIGISGKMGSGKSTLSHGIAEAINSLKCEVIPMANPIKDTASIVYKSLGLKLPKIKDRDLLIALGLWGRGKSENFWLGMAHRLYEKSDADIIICDDVRFKNEAEWFDKNGIMIRIEGLQRGPSVDKNVTNKTETALDNYKFNYIVNNKQSEEEVLMSALFCIAEHMKVNEKLITDISKDVIENRLKLVEG